VSLWILLGCPGQTGLPSGPMAASGLHRVRPFVMFGIAALAFFAGSASAQILPWEVNVAEIEAGRIRHLAERLSKQNLLYQFHLGDIAKADLIDTAAQIDRVIATLEKGSPSYSIPAPWTPELREQIERVDAVWGPLRRIAVASPYDYIRVARDFMPAESNRGDPLGIRYFDNLARDLIVASEELIAIYDAECVKTDFEVCATARTSGYAAMIIERAAKQAVFVVVGIDVIRYRAELKQTVEAYHEIRRANNQSEFFAHALDPQRGVSAAAAGALLASLREDWDLMQGEIAMLEAGDEKNFDLDRLLNIQSRLGAKVERLTAALVRYASLTYGS
jgi:hypothetical protein